jgi:hypothetical protein
MTAARWAPGETVVVRYHARDHGVIAGGYPMTCVEDSEERLVLYLPHGTSYMGYPHLPVEGRAEQVAARAARLDRPLRERIPLTWRNDTVRFFLPGRAFHVWAGWREDSWEFAWWYVNLEAAFVRTDVGVDTRDHTLDVVASPDLEWRWKDEEEAAARVEHGIDSAEFAAAVRAEGERVVELIEGRAPPFGEDWPSWRPDPEWALPELPEGWADVPAADLDYSGGGDV